MYFVNYAFKILPDSQIIIEPLSSLTRNEEVVSEELDRELLNI